ncbi:Fe-S cluster assembly protein SufB [Candidatus Micrarchaeota archaeon]|nr:Fe-S cluster assembly protein SufB [Candidatus Micrarchaeota archaeon]
MALEELQDYKYGFSDDHKYTYKTEKGLNEEIVKQISKIKGEPEWMLEKRLLAYKIFRSKPMPTWGADLSPINFDDITYYARPTDKNVDAWEMVPDDIKKTFDKIGIPEAEKKFLGGASAQYDSEVVYHNLKKEWEEQGVIFTDMDSGLREYPEIVKKYFGTVIPITDNKFAALNTSVWSGGSFVYVPEGVHVEIPLQAYFRINAEKVGQFERTLIIAEKGSKVHYVEGCTAPIYSASSLHSAVVELLAMENSHIRYTTIQNWSNNVFNLVTKRAVAYKNAFVEWLDGNIGSQITMKFPCVMLKGEGARGDVVSVAYAGKGQCQDAGGKMIHLAPNTTSRIISKSISQGGGRTSYRGLVKIVKGAKNCKNFVQCDAYMLDEKSRSDTYPTVQVDEDTATIGHEAKVGKIGNDKLFYLMSRGIPEQEALAMIVQGFLEPFTKELPMEYAVELNRLIQIQLENAVG